MADGFGGLIPFYTEFVPKHLKKRDGKPIGKRAAQKIAKQHNFPLVYLGHTAFIDPEVTAERLRVQQLSKTDRAPRGPGRPRNNLPAREVRSIATKTPPRKSK